MATKTAVVRVEEKIERQVTIEVPFDEQEFEAWIAPRRARHKALGRLPETLEKEIQDFIWSDRDYPENIAGPASVLSNSRWDVTDSDISIDRVLEVR